MAPGRRDKRSFGNIRRLPSKRYQVRFTAPDGSYVTAPQTFAARIDAEAYLADRRRQIDADLWNSQSAEKPQRVTFGAYAAAWLANRQVAGRPIKARTREHYNAILDVHLLPAFGNRQLAAIKPKEVRDWYAATLTDRPTMRSHAYSLLRTIMSSAVTDELIDANPCRIVGAGRAKRVHKIRPASDRGTGDPHRGDARKTKLMVVLASWCALRFGETVELRRGDIDLSARSDPHPARSRAHQGRLHRSPPRSPRPVFATWRYRRTSSRTSKQHLAKYVGRGRDSLLFPAQRGGHLQPSTL